VPPGFRRGRPTSGVPALWTTGERFARFLTTKLSGRPAATYVQPDLRAKVVMTRTHWEHRPLPEPATESPAQGLARTLERTGLVLQGVELVAAP